jgi:hypothetical protein
MTHVHYKAVKTPKGYKSIADICNDRAALFHIEGKGYKDTEKKALSYARILGRQFVRDIHKSFTSEKV